MKKTALLTAFVLCFGYSKAQTFPIDFNQMHWVDVAPDSSLCHYTTQQVPYTFSMDLDGDQVSDVSFTSLYWFMGGLGANTKYMELTPLHGATLAAGDSFSYNWMGSCAGNTPAYGHLAATFPDGDSISGNAVFKDTSLYTYYDSYYGFCQISTQKFIFSQADSSAYPCLKIGSDYYFLKLVYTRFLDSAYFKGYYTTNFAAAIRQEENIYSSAYFSNEHFYCTFGKSTNAAFSVMDLLGRKVQETTTQFYPEGEATSLTLPNDPGYYILRIQTDKGSRSLKFIVP